MKLSKGFSIFLECFFIYVYFMILFHFDEVLNLPTQVISHFKVVIKRIFFAVQKQCPCRRFLVVAFSYFVVFLRYPALHGSCVPGDEVSCAADQLHDHPVTYHTPLYCKYLLYVALVAMNCSHKFIFGSSR